jgi:hypothetical protein
MAFRRAAHEPAHSLSEVVARYTSPDSPEWQYRTAMADELGLTLAAARHWISKPPDPQAGLRMRRRQRDADFEAGG